MGSRGVSGSQRPPMENGTAVLTAVGHRKRRCHLYPDRCAAVAVRADPVHVWQSGDVCSTCIDRIMVRARLREQLEALQDRFGDLLAECEIKQFTGTDYAYRIFVDKSVWSQVLMTLSDELDIAGLVFCPGCG